MARRSSGCSERRECRGVLRGVEGDLPLGRDGVELEPVRWRDDTISRHDVRPLRARHLDQVSVRIRSDASCTPPSKTTCSCFMRLRSRSPSPRAAERHRAELELRVVGDELGLGQQAHGRRARHSRAS